MGNYVGKRNAARHAVLAVVVWSLVGCDLIDESHVSAFEEGAICIRSQSDTGADAPIDVTVNFQTCLSSSCSDVLANECRVTVEGDTITVEALGVVEERGGSCTSDCQSLGARCSSEPLAPGTYTLVQRGQATSLALPTPRQGTVAFGSGSSFPACL